MGSQKDEVVCFGRTDVSRQKQTCVHRTPLASDSKPGHSSPRSSIVDGSSGLFGACSTEWLVSSGLGLTMAFHPSQAVAISSSLSLPGAGEASWLSLPVARAESGLELYHIDME